MVEIFEARLGLPNTLTRSCFTTFDMFHGQTTNKSTLRMIHGSRHFTGFAISGDLSFAPVIDPV